MIENPDLMRSKGYCSFPITQGSLPGLKDELVRQIDGKVLPRYRRFIREYNSLHSIHALLRFSELIDSENNYQVNIETQRVGKYKVKAALAVTGVCMLLHVELSHKENGGWESMRMEAQHDCFMPTTSFIRVAYNRQNYGRFGCRNDPFTDMYSVRDFLVNKDMHDVASQVFEDLMGIHWERF